MHGHLTGLFCEKNENGDGGVWSDKLKLSTTPQLIKVLTHGLSVIPLIGVYVGLADGH